MNHHHHHADLTQLASNICNGQRRALARAITLIESSRRDHQEQAAQLLQQLMPLTGKALRLGISGVPGVGKSTFIEALGMHIIGTGKRLAVLSIDPSSAISGGSILGDKTRMEQLARQPQAFIRPSPAGRTLGGVARRSRETLLLCEAAGFDIVIVETVGVGQSEMTVAEMTDMFILLLLPSAGDELQGIKRGIMELADLVLVNKADGELVAAAQRAAADYRNAIRLMQPRSKHWRVPVELCSALQGTGIAPAWDIMLDFHKTLSNSSELATRRQQQAHNWLWQELHESLNLALRQSPAIQKRLPQLEQAVAQAKLPPSLAARELLSLFVNPELTVGSES